VFIEHHQIEIRVAYQRTKPTLECRKILKLFEPNKNQKKAAYLQ